MAKLFCLLLLAAACACAQVEGSVFDAATGAGVPNVKVELLKGGTPFYETATDGGGRFRFDTVREGDYAARYQSPDYWLTAGPSDYRYFHIAAAPVKLEVRLMPWSRISGRVVDGHGNPVPFAQLEVTGSGLLASGRTYLRTSWGGGGGGQLSMTPMAMTHMGPADAKGNFEVQLMPGAYELDVLPPPGGAKGPDPEPDGPPLKWTQTWYPGVAQEHAASKIVVLPGATVSVEMKLLAVPTHAVRGLVLRPDGTPAANVKLVIGDRLPFLSAESGADGAFEFPAVAEGDWPIMAEASAGTAKLRAIEWVDVGRHDVDNVKLRLAAPITLHGKVVADAPKDAPPLRPQPLILTLSSTHSRTERDLGPIGGLVPMSLNGAGEFSAPLYPGTYHFGPRLQPQPEPYYLDAILVGGVDIVTQDAEIGSDATMTVVYKSDGGSVAGKAENCASGGVLLVPGDPLRRRAGLSRSGACDANDHYEVRAIPSGDYYALAFAGNGTVPPIDEALLNQASKVTVKSGEAASLDLRAVTHPVY